MRLGIKGKFPFTSVKAGGTDIGMLTSVQGNEGPALFSVLIFIPEWRFSCWVVMKLAAKAQTRWRTWKCIAGSARVGTPGFLLGMLRPWLGQPPISAPRCGETVEEREVCSVLVWEGRTPEGGEERGKKMSGDVPALPRAVLWLP